MPWESVLKPKILEEAIVLFGTRGYQGVTTRDLAKASSTDRGSIYRLFKTKENLYLEALEEVTQRAEEELGRILVGMYAEKKNQDVAYFVEQTARRWYATLPQSSARLLQQVLIGDHKRRDIAAAPIGRVITTLGAALEQKGKGTEASEAKEGVETLVWHLFQYKVSRPGTLSGKEEMRKVDTIIGNWLKRWLKSPVLKR